LPPERFLHKAHPSPTGIQDAGCRHLERRSAVVEQKKSRGEDHPAPAVREGKVKFEVYGEEMLEKEVKHSGNSGRIYLPPEWIGKQIKVIRVN
jgi:putative transposon-encoded protein